MVLWIYLTIFEGSDFKFCCILGRYITQILKKKKKKKKRDTR